APRLGWREASEKQADAHERVAHLLGTGTSRQNRRGHRMVGASRPQQTVALSATSPPSFGTRERTDGMHACDGWEPHYGVKSPAAQAPTFPGHETFAARAESVACHQVAHTRVTNEVCTMPLQGG